MEKEKGLVTSYYFDEGKGDILFDNSGNKNNGKIYGPLWTTSSSGWGLDFNGCSLAEGEKADYVEIPSLPFDKELTIAIWVKPLPGQRIEDISLMSKLWGKPLEDEDRIIEWKRPEKSIIISQLNPVSGKYFELSILKDNHLGFSYCGKDFKGIKPVGIGVAFSHIAITFDKGKLKLFLNGEKIGEKEFKIDSPMLGSNPLQIGRLEGKDKWGFFGVITFLSVYNKALSEEEILDLYKKTKLIGDISSHKQLFIDDFIIEDIQGISKSLNQPAKDAKNPIIKPDKPWEESWIALHGTVLFDEEENIFKMWYQVYNQKTKFQYVCYAISKDGIVWNKPNLNLVGFKGSKKNNIVLKSPDKDSCLGYPIVIKDEKEPNSQKRYKMIFHLSYGKRAAWKGRLYASFSLDGIHWDNYLNHRLGKLSCEDTECLFFDPLTQKYIIHGKRYMPKRSRTISESRDFQEWSPAKIILQPDKDDPKGTEFYYLTVSYYEGVYIGFLGIYHNTSEEQTIDFQLAFSRNGRNWKRVGNREFFLPLGKPEDFDSKMLGVPSNPIILRDDKIWIYYSGCNSRHDQVSSAKVSIGRATLRLDGFVSLNASEKEGVIVTKPFTSTARKLIINANAKDGYIAVEILNLNNEIISKFSKKECNLFRENSVSHIVKWQNKWDIGILKGKKIKLRFYLRKAKLYSFILIA